MYTVVPNIRQPTTCEELGETQSYIDDMEYLLTGLQPDKILSSRCLRYFVFCLSFRNCTLICSSAIKFAELCTKPSFRMHLRTESAFERVLDLLKDASDIPVKNHFFQIIILFFWSLSIEFKSLYSLYSVCSFIGYINIWYYTEYFTFNDRID